MGEFERRVLPGSTGAPRSAGARQRHLAPRLGTSREPQVKYRQESHGTEIPTHFDEARA